MLFNLTSLSDEPVHRQIARQLLEKILSDAGYDGSELPRPRVLASEQHVSVHTIERAYQALEKEGLLTSGGRARYLIPRFTPEEKAAIRRRYFGQMLSYFAQGTQLVVATGQDDLPGQRVG